MESTVADPTGASMPADRHQQQTTGFRRRVTTGRAGRRSNHRKSCAAAPERGSDLARASGMLPGTRVLVADDDPRPAAQAVRERELEAVVEQLLAEHAARR
jgi:hypothetical protein